MAKEKAHLRFNVSAEHYDGVINNLHHGQLTQLMNRILEDIHALIKADQKTLVIDYMYKNKPLTLPKE